MNKKWKGWEDVFGFIDIFDIYEFAYALNYLLQVIARGIIEVQKACHENQI